MQECPCRYCEERSPTCHGKCIKYKTWKKENEALNKKINQVRTSERITVSDIIKRSKKR